MSPAGQAFHCGPLALSLRSDDVVLEAKVSDTLALYDVAWEAPHRPVEVVARRGRHPAPMLAGSFLTCARMSVDAIGGTLMARTRSGASATGTSSEGGDRWSIDVPDSTFAEKRLEEVEDLVGLALTTGWRREGWVPVHAAAVALGDRCALVCAPSGGGKSTVTAALLRLGWRALGDDKVLLRPPGCEGPVVAALLHTFNLHPRTREWLPEVGDLEALPAYSAWTEKRKVRAASIWPGALATRASPTHLVQLHRRDGQAPVRVDALEPAEVLRCLLRQTVVPADPQIARWTLDVIARTARHLRGLRVEVGSDVYRDGDALSELVASLG